METKEEEKQDVVYPAEEYPDERVLALFPVADNDIAFLQVGNEIPDLLKIVLGIAVGIEDVFLACTAVAGQEGPSCSPVFLVMNNPDMLIFLCERVRNPAGTVRAAVVNHDNLVIVHYARQQYGSLLDKLADRPLIVVCGKKNREAFHAGMDWR